MGHGLRFVLAVVGTFVAPVIVGLVACSIHPEWFTYTPGNYALMYMGLWLVGGCCLLASVAPIVLICFLWVITEKIE